VIRSQRRQHLARLGEIAQVAARHGFGWVFGRTPPGETAGEEGDDPRTRGRRLRAVLDELGPTFVKFGQLLSTRPDLIPEDILRELRGLQDDARPVPFPQIRAVVEGELGLTIEQVFTEFDERPLAAASIGQVHRARLPGGDEVVVKVQRPGAERRLQSDLALLHQVARVVKERVRRLQFIDLTALVDELGQSIRHELDYAVEARNVESFRRAFRGNRHVRVPRIYWRYTTPRVLTMELVEGTPLSQLAIADWSSEDRQTLAGRVTETWLEMVFVHGAFHADPHPANILVIDPDTVGLIDFGMVGRLTPRDREAAVRLLLDVVDLNAEGLPRRLRALGVRYPRQKEEELAEQLEVVLARYAGQSLGDLDTRALLSEIFRTVYRLQITLPVRWVLLDKALATLSGVALQISPEFNVFESVRPYTYRMLAERYRPDRIAGRARADIERYVQAFREYPFQISELLEEVKDGEFRTTIDLEGFREAADRTERGINRLALALVGAAMLVSSALIATLARGGPDLAGLSILAAAPAFLGGMAIAIWLVLGVIRSGRW